MDSNENSAQNDQNKSFAHILYKRLTRSIQSVLHIHSKSNSNLACTSSETSNRLSKSDKELSNKKKKQRKRKKNNKSNITDTLTESNKIIQTKNLLALTHHDLNITNKEVTAKESIELIKQLEAKTENIIENNEEKSVLETGFCEIGLEDCSTDVNHIVTQAQEKSKQNFEIFHLDQQPEEVIENDESFPDDYYEACLVGSSIVMDIDVSLVFPEKKSFFKSICGGETIHLFDYLKENEELLKKCKYFVLACASNDCGSSNDMNYVINIYTEFAQYLKNLVPNSYLICNKLIPRTYSGSQDVNEFEERRHLFNNYLEFGLPLIIPDCKIVDHPAFESKTNLPQLLYDGVHISLEGLPVYINEMRLVIDKLN